jgi:hypothetical protein
MNMVEAAIVIVLMIAIRCAIDADTAILSGIAWIAGSATRTEYDAWKDRHSGEIDP